MMRASAIIRDPVSSAIPHRPNSVTQRFVSAPSFGGGLLQRKSACACGGGCPSCDQAALQKTIQTKLKISTPGDAYEQEADRVADQVMRMSERRDTTGASVPAH